MKIKGVEYGEFLLAPMAGVSDVGFREQAVRFGASATFTEMLSARAMANNPKKTEYMTVTSPLEKTIVAQIFGHEEKYMAMALESELLSPFSSYDINMGCPAPKIVKNGEGGALMDNEAKASKIICACKNATKKPLSVKFRKGNKSENYLSFGRMCEDCGADFVTFHARTVGQGYSGRADYEALARLKAALHIPVVGSGDVTDEKSLTAMRETDVDAVMIGRGALGMPWIFSTLQGKSVTNEEKLNAILSHVCILREHYEESWLKLYIRKHLLWYTKDMPLATTLRQKIATCEDIDACLEIIKKCFV